MGCDVMGDGDEDGDEDGDGDENEMERDTVMSLLFSFPFLTSTSCTSHSSVIKDGKIVGTLGAGRYFGEIALVMDSARTVSMIVLVLMLLDIDIYACQHLMPCHIM